MKITFDGITIEDAKPKEAADMIKSIRGKRTVSSTKAGVYKLPAKVKSKAKSDTSKFDNPWTEKELTYLMQHWNEKPRFLIEAPELSARKKPAINAKKSAIRTGDKERMGHLAYKLAKEFGVISDDGE